MPAQLQSPDESRTSPHSDRFHPSAAEVLDLLGDEYTRRVFEAVSERPMSARAVTNAVDISRATAYRRLNDLHDAGLVTADIHVCKNGNHRKRYRSAAMELSISLDDGAIEAVVEQSR